MVTKVRADIDSWYEDSLNQTFEVVAIDEDEETIEVQYFDGGVEEIDFETWEMMAPTEVDEPEDLSGLFGDDESADIGYNDEEVTRPESWPGSVKIFESGE